MSHMTLEYSANLRGEGRFGELCRKLAQCMTALKVDGAAVFPPGGVRVRAIPFEEYCIADGSLGDAGFVHAVLKIGAGRSEAAKQAVSTGLFDIMKAHFAETFARQGLALSLELNEFGEAGTLKHNNLHARFKRP
ncbi:MAG TPA: 5-carboxymethyl-2-hydroxymuconate Delta-isomerase [Steroidobacteraceae bacterium]|nr:5-carboxymethyl-2-hydroxymuconate Delta-isomerase [Steroidobacteraceae bacterium]